MRLNVVRQMHAAEPFFSQAQHMRFNVLYGMKKARQKVAVLVVMCGMTVGVALSGCGGTSSGTPIIPPPPPAVQFAAPMNNTFVDAIDPANTGTQYLPMNPYAGARTVITGSIKTGSATFVNQAQYAQIYKYSDGHIYRLNLLTNTTPSAVQVSSESNATVDDLCSLNGANTALGTDVNYVATQYYNDFANPENSVYFYRLPGQGSGGTCNTTSDQIFMIRLGMTSTQVPIAALMPSGIIHDPTTGAILGFIVNEGTALTRYDQNFQNRTVLFTPTTSINVAYSLVTTGGAPTGALYVLDGSIMYVNYANNSVSSPLFTVPNWSSTTRFPASATATTEYFSVNTSDVAQKPVVPASQVYSMPVDGSAAPTLLSTESGVVSLVAAAEYGTTVAWAVTPPGGSYTIRSSTSGGAPVTAVTTSGNNGTLVVTANAIYYTASTFAKTGTTSFSYTNTQTGIVGMDGTVIEPPLANSRFVAEQRDNNGSDWLNIIRARNLTPATVISATNGNSYTEDGISGATLEVVSTSSNTVSATLGVLPAGTIMQGVGTLITTAGYLDGINVNSTPNPKTRDLIYIDTSRANSLIQLTTNLH